MEGTILVTPEELESTANGFAGIMSQVQSLTNQMMEQVNGLGAKWQGNASTAYINRFRMLDDDIEKLAKMINEHVSDLNDMARVYREAEKKNEEAGNALPGDVV